MCGAANVGKSTLVKSLVAQIAEKVRFRGTYGGKRREKLARYQVTASQLPGTTLQVTDAAFLP